MLKEPHPGRVKTRLGKEIGMTTSAWWFRHQALSLLRRLSSDRRWQVILAVSPDRAGLSSRIWPVHLPKYPQGRGNLGDRMLRMFQVTGPGPRLIIGADIPGISKRHIAESFDLLRHQEMVVGPATDGGYWLVGLRGYAPQGLFDGVRWSSEFALADTIASLSYTSFAFAETLSDVDTAADLKKL